MLQERRRHRLYIICLQKEEDKVKIKRILSVYLVFVILFSSLGFLNVYGAFEASEYGKEVYFLRDLGLADEKFISADELSRRITRGEFAHLAVSMLGLDDEAKAISYTERFTDVLPDHPYCKSILFASKLGLFGGISETEFAPDEAVYINQAIKVAVCMAGYEMHAQNYGGYPNGYIKIANDIEILNNVSVNNTSGALRGNVLILMYNTVNADMAIPSEFGDSIGYITQEGRNILSEYHNIYKSEGVFEADYHTSIKGKPTDAPDKVRINGVECYISSKKYLSLIGRNVEFYYRADGKTNTLLAAYSTDNKEIVLNAADGLSFNNLGGYYEYAGEKPLRFNLGREYIILYNGELLERSEEELMLPENGTVTLIENSGDNIYDVVIIEEYYNLVLYSYDAYTEILSDIAVKKGDFSRNIKLSDYENVVLTDKTGMELSASSLKPNNIISVYKNRQNHIIKLVVCDEFFQGKIQEMQSNGKINLLGKTYSISSDLRFDKNILDFSKEYIFYTNFLGEIVYLSMKSDSELGYITDIKKGTGLDARYYLKVFTSDEIMNVFELADKVIIEKSPSDSRTYTPQEVKDLMDIDKRNLYLFEKNKEGQIKKITYPYLVTSREVFENMPVYPFFKLQYLLTQWPDSTIKDGKIQYIELQRGFGGWLSMPEAAFTFNVPVLSNLNPDDNMFSVTPISEYNENTKFTLNKSPSGATDEIEIYSLNYDSFLADILVHYIDKANTNVVNEENPPALVTGITQGIDEETGDVVWKLKLRWHSTEKTFYIDDASILERSMFSQQKISSSLPTLAADKQKISVGDIISYQYDTFNNRITSVALLYDLENDKVSYSQSGYDVLLRFELATVKRVDRGYLEIESSHGIERCYLGPTRFIVYDKKFKTAYSGTTADLSVGDKVGIYFKWTQNLSTVIYKER